MAIEREADFAESKESDSYREREDRPVRRIKVMLQIEQGCDSESQGYKIFARA